MKLERLSENIVRIGGTLCVRSTARKIATCKLSGKPIHAGNATYRPITNGAARWWRFLASEVDARVP